MTAHPLAHPQAARPPLNDSAALPAGQAGIAVEVRPSGRRALAPQIGVDGEPALYGFGRAVIVVGPGRHVVEAQYAEPVGLAEATVRAGEVVELVYEHGAFRAVDAASPPAAVPLVRLAPGVALRALAVSAALVLAALLPVAAGAPAAVGVLLGSVLGIVGYGWLLFDTTRAYNRLLAPRKASRRSPGSTRTSRCGARRLPDGAPQPAPPTGHGAILLDLSFWASMAGDGGAESPMFDTWMAPPVLRVDGCAIAAGWGRCWFTLIPGSHSVEVTAPASAQAQAEVSAGKVVALAYHAQITVGGNATAALGPA